MAYIKFSVLSIETNLKEQSIIIHFNKELDTDTVNMLNLTIAAQSDIVNTLPHITLTVTDDLKSIIAKFSDAPIVNQRYALIINNNIKDLEGYNLDQSLYRNVIFESTVTSTIKLKKPINFEIVKDKTFSWEETGSDLVNKYRLQVSTDTAFNNIQINSFISDQTSISFGKELSVGQYYYRIRAELDEFAYGLWSEVRSFMISEQTKDSIDIDNNNDEEEPEIQIEDLVNDIKEDTDLKIEALPDNGETPIAFSFIFSEDIDISNCQINILRSDI